uniref:PPIase cyclophilin-type domain-containing protein n=1 Tax=Anas platyrhynchos platyrhynchos TaxID=8840 RepID=A0A493SXH1_ANAPP
FGSKDKDFKCVNTGATVFGLFSNIVPRTNTKFNRIVTDFACQGGDITDHDGKGGRSIYGDAFEDENFEVLQTSVKGVGIGR